MASDTKIEKQNVTISFNTQEFVPTTYVFEMDDRTDPDQTQYGVVRIRKYPAVAGVIGSIFGVPTNSDSGINIVVTEGTLAFTTETREKDVSGSSVLNGVSEFALPYPVVKGLSYYIDGKVYDKYGTERAVSIGYDSKTNKLILSRACYGRIQYSFTTTYQILRYEPNAYNDFEAYYMPDPNDYGQLLGFVKTPIGYDPEPPIVFAISPPETIAAEFELYRIESTAYAQEDGLWEKPMGWPDSGEYPNSSETLDTNGSYIEVARTHEIGYFSLLNNPRRQETTHSANLSTLPLDFTKELKYSEYAGSTIATGQANTVTRSGGSRVTASIANTMKVQNQEHFDKHRRLLNRAPKMRTVHYDVDIAEPYASESSVNAAREPTRTVAIMAVEDTQGNVERRTVVTDSLSEFRVKLVVKAPSRPVIGTAVLRNNSNDGNTDFNMQAQRINTMLSLIWAGIDWAHLRRRILASYSSDIYEVTFDSSFPEN